MKDIARVTKDLLMREGFFGHFLMGMNKYSNPNIATACISLDGINISLHINPDFWNSLTYEDKIAVLKHEMLHVMFMHPTMKDMFESHEITNLAADLEVSQYIDNFPKEICGYGDPKQRGKTINIDDVEKDLKIKLDRKAGTRYYHKILMQEFQNQSDKGDKFRDALNKMCKGMAEGPGEMHSLWKEIQKESSTVQQLIKYQIEHQLKEAFKNSPSNGRGTIPGEIAELIEKLLNPPPPIVSWRDVLKKFTGGGVETYTKKTRRKDSKRFTGNPGVKVKIKAKGLVAVDTSGSVGSDDLAEFLTEIDHISSGQFTIDLLQFDHGIQSIEQYNKRERNVAIHGRGGTEFDEPIKYLNEHRRDYGFMVMFTDGFAPVPETKPSKPLMWIITSDGNVDKDFPGFKIKMQSHDKQQN